MPDINQNHSLQSQTDFLSYLEMAGTVPSQCALLGLRSLRFFEKFSRYLPLGCLFRTSFGWLAACTIPLGAWVPVQNPTLQASASLSKEPHEHTWAFLPSTQEITLEKYCLVGIDQAAKDFNWSQIATALGLFCVCKSTIAEQFELHRYSTGKCFPCAAGTTEWRKAFLHLFLLQREN